MPLLKPDVFLNLGPIFDALNETLIAAGVLPDVRRVLHSQIRRKLERRDDQRSRRRDPGQAARPVFVANGSGQRSNLHR